jgi:hypothetical protein
VGKREEWRRRGRKMRTDGEQRGKWVIEKKESYSASQMSTARHIQDDKCSTFKVIQVKAGGCFDSAAYHTVAQIDVEIARKKGETAVM